jgi:hypothetical protein
MKSRSKLFLPFLRIQHAVNVGKCEQNNFQISFLIFYNFPPILSDFKTKLCFFSKNNDCPKDFKLVKQQHLSTQLKVLL